MNKCVLVTGGSRGIGKAIVYEFAKKDYDIVFTYLNSLDESLNIIKYLSDLYKINVSYYKCDLKKEEDVISLINLVKEKHGLIDCLINNASISKDASVEQKTTDSFKEVINVNLIGTFNMMKYIKKIMDKGVIINISSTNGIDTGYPESMDYDASKSGVISLTHNFAKIYAPNIRVNVVAPGWVNTDMNKDMSPVFKKGELDKILLNRFADPEEIAKLVCFLASDDASYINDAVIRIDGGIK